MFRSSAGAVEIDPGEQINPNEAPAASLIRLPGIGLGRARAIVAYRDQVGAQPGRPPVFTTADDLQNIKGIGPAITDDVRPWLQFGDPSEVGNAPSAR
jgi:competence protein ComEA